MGYIYYISFANGSDSNSGLSRTSPRKTLLSDAQFNNGDTQIILDDLRSSNGSGVNIIYYNKIGCRIIGDTGNPRNHFVWASTLVGGTNNEWSNFPNNLWTRPIGAGLVGGSGSQPLGGVFFKWKASIDSYGRHFGHMKYDAVANHLLGGYDYDNTTGVLSVHALTSPNTSLEDVGYQVIPAAQGGIFFNGGSNNSIESLSFALYNVSAGYPALFQNSPFGKFFNCHFWDGGTHGGSFYDNSASSIGSGYIIDSCEYFGTTDNSTKANFYREVACGNLSNVRIYNSKFHLYRNLGIDGTVNTGPSSGTSNLQFGIYGHGTSGTVLRDIKAYDCTFIEYPNEIGCAPCSLANFPAPTDNWDPRTYPIELIRCKYIHADGTGATRFRFTTHLGITKSDIDIRNCGPSGQCRDGGAGAFSFPDTVFCCLDSSLIRLNLDDGANRVNGIQLLSGTPKLYLVNTSIKDFGPNASNSERYLIYALFGPQELHIRGGLFAFSTAGTQNGLFNYDGSAVLDVDDCATYGITDGKYSNKAASNTLAEFQAIVDLHFHLLSSDPFNSDLSLIAGGSASSIRRVGTDHIPTQGGINGIPYNRFKGAFQYSHKSSNNNNMIVRSLLLPDLDFALSDLSLNR